MTLSTHVLDTMRGYPASGMVVRLLQGENVLFTGQTDRDGRCPDMREIAVEPGTYRLLFAVSDYFRENGVELPEPPFLDVVSLDFGIADKGHYHVPLLISPFAYSTYRGS